MSTPLFDQAAALRKRMQIQSQMSALPSTGRAVPVLGIASGKGGVGKSNLAVNLACALGRAGKKILLFDADFGLGNTDILLGITTGATLADAWRDGQPLSDIACPLGDGVTLIPSGSAQFALADADSLMVDGLLYELERFMQSFDLVIVDTGAGVHQRNRDTLLFCDQIVIVTTPDPTALTDSYATIKLVAQRDPRKPFAVVVNMAERIADGEETFIQLARVAEKYLKIELESWGVVPLDPRVPKAIRQQQAVVRCFPGTAASLAIARIASRVAKQPFAVPPKGIVKFLQQFFRPVQAATQELFATTA